MKRFNIGFNLVKLVNVQRVGFRLQLKKERLDEYVERHASVWPDMLAALSATGWHNYSLFLDREDATLFGYFETPDLAAALDGMSKTDVNSRWQAEMGEFFLELDGLRPDEGFLKLENIFYLQ
ncbi:MAG: L-rhamnose mutarotase [Micrococcales bacterium]